MKRWHINNTNYPTTVSLYGDKARFEQPAMLPAYGEAVEPLDTAELGVEHLAVLWVLMTGSESVEVELGGTFVRAYQYDVSVGKVGFWAEMVPQLYDVIREILEEVSDGHDGDR